MLLNPSKIALAIGAMALSLASMAAPAQAHPHKRHIAHKRVVKVCRKSSGTAGLIAGGAGGALAGKAVLGGPVGIVAGAVGGAFAGRAVDRSITAKKRCHYETR